MNRWGFKNVTNKMRKYIKAGNEETKQKQSLTTVLKNKTTMP